MSDPYKAIAVLEPDGEVSQLPEALQSVLGSSCFQRTRVLRQLLLYLWEHREEEPNEYAIATEALERRKNFDPRTDAAVRIQIARLRQRLKEFYDSEGAMQPLRIEIPHGTHQITVVAALPLFLSSSGIEAEPVSASGQTIETPLTFLSVFTRWKWTFSVVFLALSIGWLAGQYWTRFSSARRAALYAPPLPALWKECLQHSASAKLVVPTPVFFTWLNKNGDSLMARDPAINDFLNVQKSPPLSLLQNTYGSPVLAQAYVSAPDARAAFHLARFLISEGVQINMTNTSDAQINSPFPENIILIGTAGTLTPFHQYLDQLHFQIPEHHQYVIDTESPSDHPRKFEIKQESGSRSINPGIVAFLPGKDRKSSVVIIVGCQTEAIISYLTNVETISDLERLRKSNQTSAYFEAVVLSEVDGVDPLRSWVVAYKPIKSPFQ